MALRLGSRAAGGAAAAGAIAVGVGAFAVGAVAGASNPGPGRPSGRASSPSAAAPTAHIATTPARDAFSGTIRGATGRYAGHHGQASLDIRLGPSAGQSSKLTVTVYPGRCPAAHVCLDVRGTLTGTFVPAGPGGPSDVGRQFTLQATGRIAPLGKVSARGTVHGTGFILRGRETMRLTVITRRGKLAIDALSRPVPGFTSP
jgi:hypothetical protein